MPSNIGGKVPNSIPARVQAALKKGMPPRTAMAVGLSNKGAVKVKP